MKILLTNRINLIGVFIALFMYSIMHNCMIDDGVTRIFFQSIFAALISVCLYGMIFWIGFVGVLVALDLILIVPNQKKLKLKLFLEWLIISTPFIYWAVIYKEQRWFYIVAIIAFLIMQSLREKLINKIALEI
jgi:hypothetical protein